MNHTSTELRLGYPIFDIEMHILPREAAFIARHLPERYRRRYLEGFFGDARFNFDQRGGNNRADTEEAK